MGKTMSVLSEIKVVVAAVMLNGTIAMFEARVRIMSNGSATPVFSTQDIVSCSEYSQGCEGGRY